MRYLYNPHCHVKIWLSTDPNVYINLENRIRLIEMRNLNPKDTIYCLYDSSLLNDGSIRSLESFCQRHHIIPVNVLKEIFPLCDTEEEIKLISIYEIANLQEQDGGNVVVGSDILRWLKPVYQLGTYSDFDVNIDTRNLPEIMEVNKPLLLNVGSIPKAQSLEIILANNDIVAVVDSDAAEAEIKKIQSMIYSNFYSLHESNPFKRYRDQMEASDSFLEQLIKMAEQSEQTSRGLRKEIIYHTKNNYNFNQFLLEGQGVMLLDDTEKSTAELIKQETTQWAYPALSDHDLLDKKRKDTRRELLKYTVMISSGPNAVSLALFDKFTRSSIEIDTLFAPYALSSYDRLRRVFFSKNSLPLHASAQEVRKALSSPIGETCDLSWLSEGQECIYSREKKIQEKITNIPQYLSRLKENIDSHILKLKKKDLQFF